MHKNIHNLPILILSSFISTAKELLLHFCVFKNIGNLISEILRTALIRKKDIFKNQ